MVRSRREAMTRRLLLLAAIAGAVWMAVHYLTVHFPCDPLQTLDSPSVHMACIMENRR